jgi:hypothetical protein
MTVGDVTSEGSSRVAKSSQLNGRIANRIVLRNDTVVSQILFVGRVY